MNYTCTKCGCKDINWSETTSELYGGVAYCPFCGDELPDPQEAQPERKTQ